MSKMVLLAAILYLPFEIRTFWQPSWIYHLKSGLFGGHFVFTIWKPNFFVRISKGECKMVAKNNIIDIYVRFSNAICNPTYFPPFEIQICPDFRSPLYSDPHCIPQIVSFWRSYTKNITSMIQKTVYYMVVYDENSTACPLFRLYQVSIM